MDSYQTTRHLPADLLPEILCRLPVKSLLRFRCVSKPWLALVDHDTKFAQLHLKTFKNNSDETRLFLVEHSFQRIGRCVVGSKEECVVRFTDSFDLISKIPIDLTNHYWSVLSCLHGLILLKSSPNIVDHFESLKVWNSNLKVWNPSIRKWQEIPQLLKQEVSSKPLLGIDLLYLRCLDIGLGYDIVANSYKLVRLIFKHRTLHSVAIYSLGTDSWKIIDFQGDASCSQWQLFAICDSVYFRSSLYFTPTKHKRGKQDLVWFDLSKEVFSSVNMPLGCDRWTLALIGGGSSLVAFGDCSSFAWALDSESMCWTKTDLYVPGNCRFFIKKNGDMLKWWSCDDFQNEVISYNRETKEIGHVSLYVESLILHQ